MSVDIKKIAEAIKKAGDNSDELAKVYEQYEGEFKSLSEKASKFEEVESKGIFKQLKETQEKLAEIEKAKKEAEEKEAKEKGEYKTLAEQYLAEKEKLENELKTANETAGKWTTYEKTRRETLLAKLKDEKVKKIGEKLTTLEDLEEYVDLHTETKPGTGGGNHKHDKPEPDKPLIDYKTMK